jgi:hypothetical protein
VRVVIGNPPVVFRILIAGVLKDGRILDLGNGERWTFVFIFEGRICVPSPSMCADPSISFANILTGKWKEHDPYELGPRLNARNSLGRPNSVCLFPSFYSDMPVNEYLLGDHFPHIPRLARALLHRSRRRNPSRLPRRLTLQRIPHLAALLPLERRSPGCSQCG